jgi:hypothetical protein
MCLQILIKSSISTFGGNLGIDGNEGAMIHKRTGIDSVEKQSVSQDNQTLTPNEWRAVTDRLVELNQRMVQASASSHPSSKDATDAIKDKSE